MKNLGVPCDHLPHPQGDVELPSSPLGARSQRFCSFWPLALVLVFTSCVRVQVWERQIDATSAEVVRTWSVESTPEVLATFGSREGPSLQTGPIH
jgi:hypothetical protein